MIWNPSQECMSRDELIACQSRRLRELVQRVYHGIPFYRDKMQRLGMMPEDVRSIEDLPTLPFTTKSDLRDNYPFGLFGVPLDQIVRLHASSGTTGRPTVVGYTRRDIGVWSEVIARSLASTGATSKDLIQVAYGYGLFTGGLGLHYGAEKLGAAVIPISGGNSKRQVHIMRDFGTTVLACTPSYALHLAEAIVEEHVDRSDLRLRVGVFGAEPWTDGMRREIERRLGLAAMDIYGLSEVMGPGVACECSARTGLHVQEDHFLPEIIDPETLGAQDPSQKGELVFTTLTKEGLPLLRYRTRDLTTLDAAPCSCGRTTVRMAKCLARSDDMLIIRGVNVFPSQIEAVLLGVAGVTPHYVIEVDREHNLDVLSLLVEVDERLFADTVGQLEAWTASIRKELESALGVSIRVRLVEPKTIARSEGKAKRVIDRRHLQ
ncbi:MAG: phenylacetate--CoA ligase [Polyangiaceae bacterium]